MSLIPYEPFGGLDKFFEGEDFLPLIPSKWQKLPRINIENKKDKIIASVEVPGVNPKDVNISVEENILTIEGHSESNKEEKNKKYYRKEFSEGYFERTVSLPSEVEAKKSTASYKNGLLTIEMPKSNKAKAKKVEIKIKK